MKRVDARPFLHPNPCTQNQLPDTPRGGGLKTQRLGELQEWAVGDGSSGLLHCQLNNNTIYGPNFKDLKRGLIGLY